MQAVKHTIQKLAQLWHTLLSLLQKSAFWRRFTRMEARLQARWHRLPRLRYLALAGVILLSACIPTINALLKNRSYHLSDEVRALVGPPNKALASKLTYNAAKDSWQFNKDGLPIETNTPAKADTPSLAQLKAQIGGAGEKDESLYAVDMPSDGRKGVTYYDTNTNLSFTLTPQFHVAQSLKTDTHIIYPMAGGAQLIYTPKNNGMKEDIIVPKFISKELSYSYTLDLPDTLTARIQSDGSVGIFSINPGLLSNITTSTDADAEKLRSAREHAEKNHLLFAIPAPVIVQTGDKPTKATARFGLADNILTVTARDMDTVQYPASIDPSVVVTSSSDFQYGGNNEHNIEYSTSGQIGRGGVTGGSINAWTPSSSTGLTQRYAVGSVIYNDYMYVTGGLVGPDMYYAHLNPSTGVIGNWSTASTIPGGARGYPGMAAYNGFMYIYGGVLSGTSTVLDDVMYAPINSDGTIGTWTTSANTMSFAACRSGHAVYNGYLYSVGGATGMISSNCGNSSATNSGAVQYAPIKGNGDVGTWNTSANTITARKDPGVTIYNGYLYALSGTTNGIGGFTTVQYAAIQSNGDVGSWVTSATTMSSDYRFRIDASNGYLYINGGSSGGDKTRYAPIRANGDIGSFVDTSTMSDTKWGHAFNAYKGYLYYAGGSGSGGVLSDSGSAKIDAAGTATTNTSSTAFGGAIDSGTGGAGFMHNGYLYYIGGYNGSAYSSQARYASINSSGTVGTWATTSALQAPVAGGVGLGGMAWAVYGGRVYVIGGTSTVSGSPANVKSVQYASFNANGTLSAWAFTTDYGNVLGNQSAAAYGGYVYVLGHSGGGASDRVHRAPINSDGTLGSWTWDGAGSNNIVAGTSYAGMIAYGGYLYIIGGYNTATSSYVDTVQYAAINSNGSLGTWATTTALITAKDALGVTILGGYLYVMGGETASGTYSNAVEFAKLNTDGTIGSWQSSATLGVTFANGGVGIWNDRIYLMAGRQNGSRVKNVSYITTGGGGGGMAGTWTAASNSLSTPYPNGIAYNQMFAYGGYLYTVGGFSNGLALDTTWSAPLNTDGSTGTWTQQATMPVTRSSLVLSVWNGYVYACTGGNNTVGYRNDCTYAQLQSGGGLGSWSSNQTMNLSVGSVPARTRAMGTAYGGYLYVLGGANASTAFNTVYYAPLDAGTGAIGTWQAGPSFTTGRGSSGVFAAGGNLYIMGGSTDTGGGGGGGVLDDAQFASLDPGDGSVGTWQATATMVRPRSLFVLNAANGYVYVYGGTNSAGGLTMIEQAPILASGQLGTWQRAGSSTFSNPRSGGTGTIANGYVYLSSGRNSGGTFFSDVQFAPLDVQPRTARYTRLIDLGVNSMVTGFSYGGTLPGGYSAIQYRVAGSNGVFGSTGSAATPGTAGQCGGAYGNARYIWLSVTLDDTDRAVYSDTVQANLTDITVNYSPVRPAPDQRLHGGKTLQDGVLSPLDTCVDE